MRRLIPVALLPLLLLVACVESATLQPESVGTSSSPSQVAGPTQPVQKLSKYDVALRFLTAYIHLDRNEALKYASPKAVSKLNWDRPHRGNIPYYDDKMFLYYSGGLAKVYFQEVDGSYLISDFQTHNR